MVPIGFDQTNGKVPGLNGDDGGVITPPVPEPSMAGLVQQVLGAGRAPRGSSVVDRDPSVNAYSEEGAP